jgi:hypothetical protein
MADVALETIFRDPSVDVGRAGNLVVIWWRTSPNAAAIDAFAPKVEKVAAERPGVCLLGGARGMTAIPEPATRRLAAGFIRRISARARAGAFAIEDTGFRAAATRAVVTGLLALARPTVPVRIFGSREDAIGWLAPHLVLEQSSVGDVVAAVRAFGA